MKTNLKCVLMIGILVIVINLLPLVSKAQIIGFTSGDPDAPIDGGVSVLIVAGVGYGLKKARDNRKKKMVNDNNKD